MTPLPAIVVNFRSFPTGCAQALACAAEVADTGLQQGQGMHGGFGRADVAVVTAAAGPDFKTGFVDPAPVSNADVGRTMAALLGLEVHDTGSLVGRVLAEAMPGGAVPEVSRTVQRSARDASGRETVVLTKSVAGVRYFDAAGYPGRTLGLEEAPAAGAP